MKMICLALVAVFMLSVSMAMADNTSTNWFHQHQYINKDSYVDRYNEFEKARKMPLGLGLDIVVYEFTGEPNSFGLDSIEVQNKWDAANDEYSGFLVGKVNISRAIKKMGSFLGF